MSAFFRPVRLLVDMFGVPDYFSIDPTPFLTLTFLAFFGICFGDGVYGLMLIAVALLLRRKFRLQENLKAFFTLFLYCGISTVIFGALTGTWLSDLSDPKYLGENNFLLRIKEFFPYFDPLVQPDARAGNRDRHRRSEPVLRDPDADLAQPASRETSKARSSTACSGTSTWEAW